MVCGEGVELPSAEAVDCAAYMANELGQARFVVRRYSFSCSLPLGFPRHVSSRMRPGPPIRALTARDPRTAANPVTGNQASGRE